jgi:DNA-binding transcriptional LysR family regulator
MHKSGMMELDAVVALSRRGSFRAAAVDLGMSPTAVSRAVNGLEGRLGVRLFNRTTRSVSLSAAGEQFIARVAPALSEICSAMEGVNNLRDKPAGMLRINSSVRGARRILVSVVLEYLRRYPDMRVDVVTEDRSIDIIAEGFDAGIRPRDVVPGDMIAVPFGADQRFAVVGSPAYFAFQPVCGPSSMSFGRLNRLQTMRSLDGPEVMATAPNEGRF